MRPRLAFTCLALLVAGCSDSPAEPPTGLDATLLSEPTSPSAMVEPQLYTSDDGAIIAIAPGSLSGCFDDEVTAGRVGEVVVVALTHRENGNACIPEGQPVTFRIEVRPIPSKATEARFYERLVDAGGKTVYQRGLARLDLHLR